MKKIEKDILRDLLFILITFNMMVLFTFYPIFSAHERSFNPFVWDKMAISWFGLLYVLLMLLYVQIIIYTEKQAEK